MSSLPIGKVHLDAAADALVANGSIHKVTPALEIALREHVEENLGVKHLPETFVAALTRSIYSDWKIDPVRISDTSRPLSDAHLVLNDSEPDQVRALYRASLAYAILRTLTDVSSPERSGLWQMELQPVTKKFPLDGRQLTRGDVVDLAAKSWEMTARLCEGEFAPTNQLRDKPIFIGGASGILTAGARRMISFWSAEVADVVAGIVESKIPKLDSPFAAVAFRLDAQSRRREGKVPQRHVPMERIDAHTLLSFTLTDQFDANLHLAEAESVVESLSDSELGLLMVGSALVAAGFILRQEAGFNNEQNAAFATVVRKAVGADISDSIFHSETVRNAVTAEANQVAGRCALLISRINNAKEFDRELIRDAALENYRTAGLKVLNAGDGGHVQDAVVPRSDVQDVVRGKNDPSPVDSEAPTRPSAHPRASKRGIADFGL